MALDPDAYLSRIGYRGPLAADTATLRALHLAHATHIPFENLDIQMGLPIRLDLDSLQDKLVRRRRGGYCFEQNSLLQAVLRSAGFEVIA
jgi:N-hydroxyarylamine O-acetyltransferase